LRYSVVLRLFDYNTVTTYVLVIMIIYAIKKKILYTLITHCFS